MSSSYDRQQKSTTNVRRSNSSPSSVLRSTIRRQQQQPKNYDENDADDEYNRPIVNYNPNETYYDLYRRQQQQQQINNQKISLNRRSSFIHHRHSFHHPQDYIYDNNYDYYYEQQHRTTTTTTTRFYKFFINTVKQITILLLKWIFLPIFTFLHYFYLLFYIIFNLFISLLQFYLMIMAFIVNYLGIDHYRSLLFGYLNLFRFWHYQQQQLLLKNSNRHYPNELYLDSTIKRSISCGDNLDRQQQQPTTLNRYSKQSKKSFRNLSGTIPLKSNTGQLLNLKCNYQTYYVDIGSRWDLDHVRIWTMEIEPDSMNDAMTSSDDENRQQKQQQPPDLLPQVGLVKNQHYLSSQQNKLPGLPLVMIHGFAAGIGLWALNLDDLARRGNRQIFAFDLLGFAKSSRPRFPSPRFPRNLTETQRIKAEAEQMESYYVECLEKWRQTIGEPLSKKFILLGHSFGAYIAMAYALKHPSHVAHIILADAWGIPPETQSRHLAASGHITTRQLPWWAKLIGRMFLDIFNPLSLLRAIGPWGPFLLHTARADIKYKFERLTKGSDYLPWKRFSVAEQAENPPPLESSDELSSDELDSMEDNQMDENDEPCVFLNYIYHCNAQSRPSGEIAFKKLCTSTGWARLPILDRIQDLDPRITLTFIYGSRSWIDRQTGLQAKYILATKSGSAAGGTGVGVGGVGNHPRLILNSSDENSDHDDDLMDLDGLHNQQLRRSKSNIEQVEIHVIQGAVIKGLQHQTTTGQQQQLSPELDNTVPAKIRPGRKYGNYLRPTKFSLQNPDENRNNNDDDVNLS
ncbi:hypothetical protein DERP_009034 [Dermatophagoides pteronyssinus]|uniref:AB hydrolase-1 domain-containing protein n=1 Tax=Dermatophagoides pteronyssinus TaxID=6956 RepID=A0ABQ8JH30_DERPT|nr:hypothetical protein DERP_009034 [Dermatophagoides pteronyssinus]